MPREELVNLTDAKVKLHEIIRDLPARVVLILKWGKPVAAVLDYQRYQDLLEQMDDLRDRLAVYEAREEADEDRILFGKVKAEAGLLD